MAKTQNMCPNPSCTQYQESTPFLGGCDKCGASLVPYYIEPSNEQLARFAIAVHSSRMEALGIYLTPDVPTLAFLLEGNEEVRQRLLREHKLVQMEANRLK